MARSYADIRILGNQMLQDTGRETYDTPELGYWIEECLKEFSPYDPHIVLVTFKIEARTGTATSTSATWEATTAYSVGDYVQPATPSETLIYRCTTAGTSSGSEPTFPATAGETVGDGGVTWTAYTNATLVDATNDQFLATDDDNEKVVYNTADETWAVVTAYVGANALTLSADIMASGEGYKIYNEHCYNNKQVYIGDAGDYLWIDKVEYKCSKSPRSWRNWKLYGDVLEIDIDFTPTDGDEVNVYFARPHKLCELADLKGEVHTAGTAGDTTMQIKSFTDDEIVEIGDEFYIVGHKSLYTITTGVTLAYQVAAGSQIGFYPGLEAAAPADAVINFTKSTLKPQHEEIFCHLVAARAVLSKYIGHINTIPKGGDRVIGNYRQWAYDKLGEVLGKLDRLSPPRTKRIYPRS